MNRAQFFHAIPLKKYNDIEIGYIQSAYWLSKKSHDNQARDSGERYFEHPRAVALLMIQFGFVYWKTICAALLHDCVEDCYTPSRVYINLFDAELYSWVLALSKKVPHHDPLGGQVTGYIKKDLKEYFKTIAELPANVRAIKCCDRLHNLSTCNNWAPERRRRYVNETIEFILPLADATDAHISAALCKEIARIEADLNAIENPTTV